MYFRNNFVTTDEKITFVNASDILDPLKTKIILIL